MKKNIFNAKTLLIPLILISSVFTGCHDYIFDNIMDDVPPEEASVSGNITSIARYTNSSLGNDYLVSYSQNGLIYKNQNDNSHGTWKVYQNLPFELQHYDYYNSKHIGQQILKVLADSDYLYVVSVSYRNDYDYDINAPEQYYIWSAKIENWNTQADWKIIKQGNYSYKEGNYYYTNFNVFCTNAPQQAHRKAYMRIGDSDIYMLNGTSVSQVSSPNKFAKEPNGNSKIDSVVYFAGDYYLLDAIAVTTNETATSAPTYLYFAVDNSESIFYTTSPSNDIIKVLDAGEEVSCLAYTNDSLLIGRADTKPTSGSYGGIVKVNINNNIPENNTTLFTTNAAVQMPSSYLINTLLVVDPSKNEIETAIYSSISFRSTASNLNFENIGMWSYYPSRKNWNRE